MSRLAEAQMVVFHLPNLGRSTLLGLKKHPGQVWASWTLESDAHYPLQADAEFSKLFDVSIGFGRQATVRQTYVPKLEDWTKAVSRPVAEKTEAAPVAVLQSASTDRSGRNQYLRSLMRELAVDSYGKFLNNRSLPHDDGQPAKTGLIGRYSFCLAFENSRQTDYVTEKLFQPLLAGSVPVYLGAPNVTEFAPAGSFINTDDFSSPRDLARYLLHLVATPEEYRRYFDWRNTPLPEPIAAMARASGEPVFERLVDYVSKHGPTGDKRAGKASAPFGVGAYLRLRYRLRSR